MPENITFADRDEFNRKPFACNLIKLLEGNNDLSPLAINGAWGTGKTEFCLKTVHLINSEHNDKLVAGYFDAFSEDHFNDPLTSLLATLYKSFISNENDSDYLALVAKIILASGQKILNHSYPIIGELTQAIKEARDSIIKENFANRANIESNFEELRLLIEKIAHEKTFILFIDELDRCRPDFALHLLEAIKHVFNTEHLKIVFVINFDQLAEIVKLKYGNSETISHKYLDKFFQLQLKLPNITINTNSRKVSNSITYFEIEGKRLKLFSLPIFTDEQIRDPENSIPSKLLKELIEFKNLSLRDVEKLTKYISVYSSFIKCEQHYYLGVKLITAYAIFQFTFNEEIYRNYKNHNDAFITPCKILSNIPPNGNTYKSLRYVLYELLFGDNHEVFASYMGGSHSFTSLEERRMFLTESFSALENLIKN